MVPAWGDAVRRGIADVRRMGHNVPMQAILPLTMHFSGPSVMTSMGATLTTDMPHSGTSYPYSGQTIPSPSSAPCFA